VLPCHWLFTQIICVIGIANTGWQYLAIIRIHSESENSSRTGDDFPPPNPTTVAPAAISPRISPISPATHDEEGIAIFNELW